MGRSWHTGDPYTPPADPYKPALPYKSGSLLKIRRDYPPHTWWAGRGRRDPPRQLIHPNDLATFRHTQVCLEFPVLDLISTAPPTEGEIHTLEIVDEIACGDGRGAQLVTCYKDGDRHTLLVAKIYDPLYYDFGVALPSPSDVNWYADTHYVNEVAAYRRLQLAQLDFVPKYHGSWIFEQVIPTQPPKRRNVRMVLMEYIRGETMASIFLSGKVKLRPATDRIEVMAKAMEMICKIGHYGIGQIDFAPRNVILADWEPDAGILRDVRVFMIDFNTAIVRDPTWQPPAALPTNPIDKFGTYPLQVFGGWLPEELHNRDAYKAWMYRRWGGSKDFAPLRRRSPPLPSDDSE